MRLDNPPLPDDQDAYIWVDHRAEETEIIVEMSSRIHPADALIVGDCTEGGLPVTYRGMSLQIPLTGSPHDRYVAISSVAELLKERYRIFLLASSLSDDTHGMLVVSRFDAERWAPRPEHLVPLDLGYDYFHQIRVPYLGHPDAAPQFKVDQEHRAAERDVGSALIEMILSGKQPARGTIPKMAEVALRDPELAAEHAGLSPQELSLRFSGELAKVQAMPEVQELQREMGSISQQVAKALQDRPVKKPWWKFWS
jgi:hypothetical protein